MSPDGVSACLLEEIFQSMGFFGETPGHPETVLDDDVGYQELGAIDRLLLRTLYDPRLSAGMTATGRCRWSGRSWRSIWRRRQAR